MVVHHRALREPGWRRQRRDQRARLRSPPGRGSWSWWSPSSPIGAWMPAVVIPMIVVLFKAHQPPLRRVAAAVASPSDVPAAPATHTVVVLVGSVHQGVLERSLRPLARARPPRRRVGASTTRRSRSASQDAVGEFEHRRPARDRLLALPGPTRPILRYLDELDDRWSRRLDHGRDPRVRGAPWWEHLLHNQSALVLKGRLLFRRDTAVLSLPVPHRVTRA